jgi:hypothetical protein
VSAIKQLKDLIAGLNDFGGYNIWHTKTRAEMNIIGFRQREEGRKPVTIF